MKSILTKLTESIGDYIAHNTPTDNLLIESDDINEAKNKKTADDYYKEYVVAYNKLTKIGKEIDAICSKYNVKDTNPLYNIVQSMCYEIMGEQPYYTNASGKWDGNLNSFIAAILILEEDFDENNTGSKQLRSIVKSIKNILVKTEGK